MAETLLMQKCEVANKKIQEHVDSVGEYLEQIKPQLGYSHAEADACALECEKASINADVISNKIQHGGRNGTDILEAVVKYDGFKGYAFFEKIRIEYLSSEDLWMPFDHSRYKGAYVRAPSEREQKRMKFMAPKI
jgi:hypothetical protein